MSSEEKSTETMFPITVGIVSIGFGLVTFYAMFQKLQREKHDTEVGEVIKMKASASRPHDDGYVEVRGTNRVELDNNDVIWIPDRCGDINVISENGFKYSGRVWQTPSGHLEYHFEPI